jgi:radical SAM protein with 4Fe4S-binding SPASM domain
MDQVQSRAEPSPLSEFAPSPKGVGNFLIELFDLWFQDQDGLVDFKELRQELKMILQPEIDRGDPFHKKRCDFRRLIFAPDGLAFSCDQWLNEEKTALGDIRTDSLESILERKALLWEQIKRGVRKSGEAMGCGKCEWGRQCGGGCLTCMKYNALLLQSRAKGLPDSRWAEQHLPAEWSEIKGETYYCDGLRAFRRHVREAVQRETIDAE